MMAIANATGNALYTFDWKSQRESYLNALRVERTMVRLLVMVIMAIATLNIIVGVAPEDYAVALRSIYSAFVG